MNLPCGDARSFIFNTDEMRSDGILQYSHSIQVELVFFFLGGFCEDSSARRSLSFCFGYKFPRAREERAQLTWT